MQSENKKKWVANCKVWIESLYCITTFNFLSPVNIEKMTAAQSGGAQCGRTLTKYKIKIPHNYILLASEHNLIYHLQY